MIKEKIKAKIERYDRAMAGDADLLIELCTERGIKFDNPEDDKKLAQVLIVLGEYYLNQKELSTGRA